VKRIIGILRTFHQLGWANGCLYGLSRVFEIISGNRMRIHKYYFVAQPVAKSPWLPSRRGQAYHIRQIAKSDPLVKLFPRPDWAAPYRFAQGAVCLAAFKEGSFAGFIWLALSSYLEDEVRCRYLPLPRGKCAWDFDVHVEPEHRTGILFMKLWDEANRFLVARRIEWSLSRISAFNSGSILSHAKMGARRIGTATFLSLGPWQLAISTFVPRLHLSTRSASYPTYSLNPEP
jgi:hypothetical protein